MSNDALDALPKILVTSIIGAFAVAAVLWHIFIKDLVFTALQQSTAPERFIGLTSGVIIVFFGMAAVMFPLMKAHEHRMNASFDGYEVSYSLSSFLPKKLLGTATVKRVRHDHGRLLGMSTSPKVNARRDRIHEQRKQIECEYCHKTLNDIHEPGDLNDEADFTYVEKYKRYYCILPLYASHIETIGYCPHHRPEELEPNTEQ